MPASRNKTANQRTTTRGRATGAASTAAQTPWTFLTNYAHVLIVLDSDPDMVLREVATRVGITERAVQRIVQELEEEGFLRRERVGRRNHYQITSGKHLRHPVESHCTIDQVLALVAEANTAGRKPRSRKRQIDR